MKNLKIYTIFDSRDGCNAIIETASNTLVIACINSVIPGRCNKHRRQCFQGVFGLTSITIPDAVTSIGQEAFCSSFL
ncbi:MAG: hypothetical protein IJF46_08255 [Bacteroidaceae bacterium]|nr:hypothetical protein [Bacteroidaceae bacterium]